LTGSGWTDGNAETITAAQAAIHQAARSILSDLEEATDQNQGE